MTAFPEGWTFADSNAMDWQQMGPGVEMKMMGAANGKGLAMFRFEPGYVGNVHQHPDSEFTFVLEGEVISQGVKMLEGHGYAVEGGTTHEEFRTEESSCTVVSVFNLS